MSNIYLPAYEKTTYSNYDLALIREYPHILGHIAGKDRLTKLHSEWIRSCWESEQDFSLQAHRDAYKTTAVMVTGSIWWLLFHPNDRIGIIRKSFTDAALVVGTIKEIMMTPAIRELFRFAHGYYPEFKIKREGLLTFTFKETITPEGNVNAYGIKQTLTGTHLDKIGCDDFVTLEDRISPAEREKTKSRIREIRTNIIESGKCCFFIGTPWHKDDAWTVCPPAVKYNVYQTGIISEKEIENKRKKTTKSLFACNYELVHQAEEGKLFIDPIYGRWSYNIVGTVGHIDAAFDGNNTNALTFFAKRGDKIQGYGKAYSGHVKDWLDVIYAEYKKRRCKKIWVENNTDKGYTAKMLRSRGMIVGEYPESINKHEKITAYLYDQWPNIEWDVKTDPEYLVQITDYEKGGEPDDAPDSASSLIYRGGFSSVNLGGGDDLYKW